MNSSKKIKNSSKKIKNFINTYFYSYLLIKSERYQKVKSASKTPSNIYKSQQYQ